MKPWAVSGDLTRDTYYSTTTSSTGLRDMNTNSATGNGPRVKSEKFDQPDLQVEQISLSGDSSVQRKKFVPSDAEKRLVRKLDMRIMPILSVIYLFACKFVNGRGIHIERLH